MNRVVLRHLSGSKSNQVEEFPIPHFHEIIVGRDPSATLKFDPDRDDLVGRQHAKIVVNADKPGEFTITDLNSRNGTYVNRQRIFGETRIAPGDIIQFGPNGPQVQFDIEPKPTTTVAPTRIAAEQPGSASGLRPVPPTREGYAEPAPAFRDTGYSRRGIGKETVERMIADSTTRTRRSFILGGSALGAVGLAGAAYLYRRRAAVAAGVSAPVALNAAEIMKANAPAVVFIDAAWKLIDIDTGRQVYHLYVANKNDKGEPMVIGGAKQIPVYIQVKGSVEPMLIDNDDKGTNRSIGGKHSATGFLVHQDGFILTNRHVAATWQSSYVWFPDEKFSVAPGLLVDLDAGKMRTMRAAELPLRWVPASSKRVVLRGSPSGEEVLRLFQKQNPEKALTGRHDFLNVTFPDTSARIPARLARTSDKHDVALIKIDITELMHTLEMDDKTEVRAGDPVVVLGYPAVSPNRVASIRSRDQFKPDSEQSEVPGLTVSTGNIGKVMMDDASRATYRDAIINPFGEYYQLTVNSTGSGNSGGPVFDERGKVIGIFSAGIRMDAAITLAVPIKYGTELTRVSKTADAREGTRSG